MDVMEVYSEPNDSIDRRCPTAADTRYIGEKIEEEKINDTCSDLAAPAGPTVEHAASSKPDTATRRPRSPRAKRCDAGGIVLSQGEAA